MNRPINLTGAPASPVAGPRSPEGASVPKSLNPIGANALSGVSERPTGETGAPNLSTLSKPWGAQPICSGCNRGKTYSCICDPFFEDEDTPEPRFDPEGGWAFSERMALGMVKP